MGKGKKEAGRKSRGLSRRQFLRRTGAGLGGLLLADLGGLRFLEAREDVANPLAHYPDRDWEKLYRDLYAYDSHFPFVCAPNDTHNCRIRALVRNGVITRIGNEYDVEKVCDLYGNHATCNWNPRQCAKGYTFHRIVYGPHRLKFPICRKGWKQWADDGFPYLTPELRTKYKFDSRGTDKFVRVSWDDAFRYLGRALVAIAKHYSGELGRQRLQEQGYQPEMIAATQGAGTRCLKFRGGMGLLGVIGKYGMYRLANTMAYVDQKIRGVPDEEALGGRNWSNYTWHGDQAPGHPWVHGLQNSECDFNDLRFSKLIIQNGKNLVENKMTDSHWFIECMERGATLVTITPEYSAPATKSDYWIPVRPSTDAALWLGIARRIIENKGYDEAFVLRFTDLPLLVRTDTLKRLRAADIFPDYRPGLSPEGASFKRQGLTQAQYQKLGDFVVWDRKRNGPAAITRDDVGDGLARRSLDPVLAGTYAVRTVDGKEVEVKTLWTLYLDHHLKDYDLDTVCDITGAPKDLLERLAKDLATIKPAAIHQGEGINHWFHGTEGNRAAYLVTMLTGNLGRNGAGCHGWAGNYKAALFQGSPWTGPGFKGWVAEDPFHVNLDPEADGKDIRAHGHAKDEEPAYWNHGDKALIVDTPKFGRRCFTGQSHMPTPTKAMLYTNVNLLNNAKHAYDMLKNVNPKVELIVSVDTQMTASVEYSDFGLPANSWAEALGHEITASCSNPFLQIWKGGIQPLYDSKDDAEILGGIGKAVGEALGDPRCAQYWKFILEGRREVYIQRLLDSCTTTRGYKFKDIVAGKYGPPGSALMLFRTYPRVPFWEQIQESQPFFTDTGRLHAYSDDPTALACGENFIVHREGPEATPYLPNVIVSTNPYVRPEDYGIPLDAEGWDERTIRNVKRSWAEVKQTRNFLWERGFRFYCITPKSRHHVHTGWVNVDWHQLWDSSFGDPFRADRRSPGVGEHQAMMNPQAARDLGLNEGDYAYVDANPADRPYVGASPDDPFYRIARCMVRLKYNPSVPYRAVIIKHGAYMATERSVKAQETRPDGLALTPEGYQSNCRFGSQQSITRNWHMPMHQTDTLFHKAKVFTSFIFGGEADNHAINTVPKETLVRVVKAEDGGLGGKGLWLPAQKGQGPDYENAAMLKYLAGGYYTET
jgi:nitrate reductase alpha subunit